MGRVLVHDPTDIALDPIYTLVSFPSLKNVGSCRIQHDIQVAVSSALPRYVFPSVWYGVGDFWLQGPWVLCLTRCLPWARVHTKVDRVMQGVLSGGFPWAAQLSASWVFWTIGTLLHLNQVGSGNWTSCAVARNPVAMARPGWSRPAVCKTHALLEGFLAKLNEVGGPAKSAIVRMAQLAQARTVAPLSTHLEPVLVFLPSRDHALASVVAPV